MKCLITGATGFIGNALVKRLIKNGHEVTVLVHKTKPKNYEKKIEYINGDITDIKTLKPLTKDIDFIFHCAANVKDYGTKKKFYKINYEGTKNLVLACKKIKLKRFIFLSHIRYDSKNFISYYTKTKALAEQYLLSKFKNDNFPVVIIRPGNVYGPGATTWVLRPLEAIQKNHIALIENGRGIFLHTYIDNLIDALISSMEEPNAVGEVIDITDGDNNKTWGEYLNDLANIAGKKNIKRNISKSTALIISKIMIFFNKIFRIKPIVTPMAVSTFLNDKSVSLEKAEKILKYTPKINYNEGIKKVQKWLQDEKFIK